MQKNWANRETDSIGRFPIRPNFTQSLTAANHSVPMRVLPPPSLHQTTASKPNARVHHFGPVALANIFDGLAVCPPGAIVLVRCEQVLSFR